jgi:hypothetical protein
MSRYIYIYENTKSIHDKGVETQILCFKKLGYSVVLCVNNEFILRVADSDFFHDVDRVINITSIIGMASMIKAVKHGDLVLYNTISVRNSYILFLLSFFIKNNIYYIRSASSWIQYSNHKSSRKNKIFRFIVFNIKRYMLKRAHSVIVANNNIKKYLSEHVREDLNIGVLPFRFFEKPKSIENYNSTISFVIPGGVDLNAKPLGVIKEATLKFSKKELSLFQIILLGKTKNQTDISFCEDWKDKIGSSLSYSNEFISNSDFERGVVNASYILSSIKIDYEGIYLKEIYGTTKDSGVDAQAIAHGKPLIVNLGFKVPDALLSSTIYYDTADSLYSSIKNIIENKKYNKELAENAVYNSSFFTIDRIADYLKNIL